jgi:glucose-6-phosphate isomerase
MRARSEAPRTRSASKHAVWRALEDHHVVMWGLHLGNLFADDPARGERMTAEAAGVYLDYSKNRINDETLKLLLELAEQSGLRARIDAMFRGEKINVTENRAVLHVALRAPKGASIIVGIGGSDLGPVMAYEALRYYSDRAMTFRFVSNVDGTDFVEATRDLDPGPSLTTATDFRPTSSDMLSGSTSGSP